MEITSVATGGKGPLGASPGTESVFTLYLGRENTDTDTNYTITTICVELGLQGRRQI